MGSIGSGAPGRRPSWPARRAIPRSHPGGYHPPQPT
jgi:hypothetical protein